MDSLYYCSGLVGMVGQLGMGGVEVEVFWTVLCISFIFFKLFSFCLFYFKEINWRTQ